MEEFEKYDYELILENENPLINLLYSKNLYGVRKSTKKCLIICADYKSITADFFIVENKIIKNIYDFNSNDEILEKYKNKIIYGVYLQSYYRQKYSLKFYS